MPWTPKIGFGNDLKCSFVSLYISEFIAITYLPRSFALPAFSRTEHENKMFANVHRTTLTFTKKKLEITSCLKSSKSGKSWFWKYWLRWVEDGRCTTSYHVTWVQSYILIVFLRCKIGIQYANTKFTGRNLPLKCFLPLPQSVATGGWSMIWGCAANHLGSRVSGGEPCIFTSLPIASTQGQGGKWTRGCCK